MSIAVVITVKNEAGSLEGLLESLCAQTRQPDEVVIVDGGSTDGTLEILRTWEESRRLPLRMLSEPGCSISRGRNRAIAASESKLIASTDAGVRLDAGWLDSLARPLIEGSTARRVACGFFLPDPRSVFEVAMGATVLPRREDVRPERFLPSSRSVAFARTAWEAVGGYPEWLDYCEDLVFDLRLLAMDYRLVFVPEALVHFRPRPDLRSFAVQYYRYARGDGKADLWRVRHLVRYVTYLVALPVLLALAARASPAWLGVLVAGAAAMLFTPYKRLWPELRPLSSAERVAAVLWVPVIRVTGDLAKMAGYPVGVLWRLKRRDQLPNWRAVDSTRENLA
ncbi:MAG TPA: glycosyltransferase [Anaerolineae bacterium]|nr:glycosyltransferase [Anaerolineae bacterium]